jgi:hypothetical protein
MSGRPVSAGSAGMTGVLPARVTHVSASGLHRCARSGDDAPVLRPLLEPFWPGRRAHAYDQFCR